MYYVYIVVRHHDNASAQANRVIGQPYALEDEASIRLLSRWLITRAPGSTTEYRPSVWIPFEQYELCFHLQQHGLLIPPRCRRSKPRLGCLQ